MFSGPGSIRLSNEACGPYTVHYVFDTYAQANVTGLAAVKSGLDSWFFLTADYAFGQDLEKDTTNVVLKSGGKVLGSVRHPLNTSDFLVLSAAGAGFQGKGDRAGECRRRHHQRDQAGRRIRHHEVRPEDVAAAGLRHRYRQRRPRDRAGPAARRSVLLGPQRRYPGVLEALHGAHQAAADLGAGRRLFVGAALSAGGEGRRHHRFGRRHEDHEGHPDQRHVRQERPHPRGRPHGARHVSVRGQEAVGIQGALGRLQAARHRARRTRRSSRWNSRAARW